MEGCISQLRGVNNRTLKLNKIGPLMESIGPDLIITKLVKQLIFGHFYYFWAEKAILGPLIRVLT